MKPEEQIMPKHRTQISNSNKAVGKKEKIPEKETARDGSENCRCKEVAKKTPREMLGLMISDLTFWKKDKGKK